MLCPWRIASTALSFVFILTFSLLFPAAGVNFYLLAWVCYCANAYNALLMNPNPASHRHFSF